MEKNVLINHTTGKEYVLKDLGDVSVPASLWVYWAVGWGVTPTGLPYTAIRQKQVPGDIVCVEALASFSVTRMPSRTWVMSVWLLFLWVDRKGGGGAGRP
jgi:hypothetical protein